MYNKAAITKEILSHQKQNIREYQNFLRTLSKMNHSVINYMKENSNFKFEIAKQVIQLLFERCISQAESILILIRYGKYIEAKSILRNLFESGLFMLYFDKYPSEARRWLEWNNLDYNNKKTYRRMKFSEFKKFLAEKKYVKLLDDKHLNENSFKSFRDFQHNFIRNLAFEGHPDLKGNDFAEVYDIMCKYTHPSLLSLNFNNKYVERTFLDLFCSSTLFLNNITPIFLFSFKKIIPSKLESSYNKINQKIAVIRKNNKLLLQNI